MLRWIVGSSLKFRYIVVGLAAALMFFGVGQLQHTPVDVFPEFAPPRVEVQTASLGLSPQEVEELVTVPLEHALNGLPDLDVIRSSSVEQLSSIELLFKQGTDLLKARQLVAERVSAITPTLPTWAAPPVIIQPLSATSRVMKIGLRSTDPNLDLMDLSMTAYWKIRSRLLQVPGVANVPIWGERIDMPQVRVDPKRLRKHNLTLENVLETTSDALDAGLLQYSEGSWIGRGGFIDTPSKRMEIRHIGSVLTAKDLARVPIATEGGKVLQLQDVAEIARGTWPLAGDAVINDGPGLMLIVEKLPWANTLDVTNGVEDALQELRPGLQGIAIDPTIFRPASFIELSIDNLSQAFIIGALLMIFMLGAFLYEWRTAVISVVAMPLALIAAALVLKARGATINTMILAGFVIALGDIVDDAIIDIENVVRRLREHRKEGGTKSTARVILEASLEVRSAIVYATLLEVAAVAPILTLAGLSGSFFRPLAISYSLALLASMLVALTVTPALSLIFFRKASSLQHRESPLVPPLKRAYQFALGRIITRPRRAYAGVAATAVLGVVALPFLGQSLFPDFKERDFLMHWVTQPGTSHPEEVRITTRASRELRALPGVRNFGAHIGQAISADEVHGVNFGENWVSVDPKADYEETVESIEKTVEGYPGLFRDVQTYLVERIHEVLTGSSNAITVRIFGPDLDVLREKADQVNGMLGRIPGVVDNQVDLIEEVPQIQVKVDLAAARKYGVKPGDIRRATAYMVAGEEAGDIFRSGKAYDVNVWSAPETRSNITDLKTLLIDTPYGGQVELQDVANVAVVPTPNAIDHEGLFRKIDVGANVRGRDVGSVVADLERRMQSVRWPQEFHAELLGENAERQTAQTRLFAFAAAAAIAIFLLLQASFASWRLATFAFFTLPIALVGGLLAVAMTSGILSLGALIGLFTVLGIVARNGIMLISHYQHLERFEGEPFGPRLVIRGALERLTPIMMTVLTSGLALVPLILTGERPGQEIEHPMAVVILGGLVTATLLNLFVVPSLYLRFGKRASRDAASEPTRSTDENG